MASLPFPVFMNTEILRNGFAASNFLNDRAEWLERTNNHPFRLLMEFRGATKTTTVAAYLVWRLLHDHNENWIIVSSNEDSAKKIVDMCRKIIKENDLCRPLRRFGRDTDLGFDVGGKTRTTKESSIEGVSIASQKITGSHGHILADDVEVARNADSDTKRKNVERNILELQAVTTGQILWVGTPHASPSIYTPMLDNPIFEVRKIPVVDFGDTPEDEESWVVAWDDHPNNLFSKDRIKHLMNQNERWFRSQYMLEETNLENSSLNGGLVRRYRGELETRLVRMPLGEPDVPVVELALDGEGRISIDEWGCYWDVGYSKDGSDASVFSVAYRDKTGRRFIHVAEKLPPVSDEDGYGPQARRIVQICQKLNIPSMKVEESGASTYSAEVKKAAKAIGVNIEVLPVRRTYRKEKYILDAFEPVLNAGLLYIHEDCDDELVRQINGFPRLDHDDFIDSGAGCLVQLREPDVDMTGTKSIEDHILAPSVVVDVKQIPMMQRIRDAARKSRTDKMSARF